jgi:prepilin-type N-terminal cleavage/methylation domain-containing protein
MKTKFNEKGITLIELLIALVISGIIVAAIYRLFVAQTRSYTVQDQVAEVQQNVRSAMEILVRDIRQAGLNNDKPALIGGVEVPIPGLAQPIVPVGNSQITIFYEQGPARREVTYFLNGNTLRRRQIPTDPGGDALNGDPILENVSGFTLTYAVDVDPGPPLVYLNDRRSHNWVSGPDALALGTNANIVGVRVQLSARPDSDNPDFDRVSPRSLDTAVAVRNQMNSKRDGDLEK